MADDDNGTQNAQGTAQGGEQTVPIAEVSGLRTEVRELKQTIELQTDQIDLYRANQQQTQQQAQTQQQNVSQEGVIADEEVITGADLKRIMAGQEAKFKNTIDQLQVQTEHSDFNTIVNKYVPILAKQRPDLARTISTSANPGLIAYELCKTLPEYAKDQKDADLAKAAGDKGDEDISAEAQQILDNQAKPGTASAAGGSGGGKHPVQFYTDMKEEDLEAKIEEVKNRG